MITTKYTPHTQGIVQQNTKEILNILLIEDDAADDYLIRRAFAQSEIHVNIQTFYDGDAALKFLRQQDSPVDSLADSPGNFLGNFPKPFPRPDIVLTELYLPKKNGYEILQEIKGDQALADIPVIIISDSLFDNEIVGCYRTLASGFICKPFEYEVLEKKMNILAHYWADVVDYKCNDLGLLRYRA